ncbi:MAG: STAS domain-containing protein [Bacillota bacterium]|nr:STAS domain-containing protein [Bacillota bacterium]
MEDSLRLLGENLLKNKLEIAKKVHESRIVGITEEEKRQLASIEEDIIQMRVHFISLFGEILKDHLDEEAAFQKVTEWGKETGEIVFKLGAPLDEALKDTRYYRSFIWQSLKDDIKKNNMSIDLVFELGAILNPLLDHAAYAFSLTYVHQHQMTLENAKNAFLELSVPVVPLTKGVAILPLIGNIDTERANMLMEETLISANKLQLQRLILDLSGVYIVDTMVADRIFKVIASLKLLGVETVLTGIRPEVAQTIVSIGLDFSNLSIKANLQKAMEELFSTK